MTLETRSVKISVPQAPIFDRTAGKDIMFFSTNRVHMARQKLLLQELSDRVHVVEVATGKDGQNMIENTMDFIGGYYISMEQFKPRALVIRGDRYELLPAAMLAAYRDIPIFHIEGGDMSGAIDNRVRNAITHLADYHFCTNWSSHDRLVGMGVPSDRVWNFGSLDAEYAYQKKDLPDPIGKPFALILNHPLPGEDDITPWVEAELGNEMERIYIKPNQDYTQTAGGNEYDPDTYLALLNHAKILIGNSSSFLKEASVYGTSTVLVGDRQKGRMRAPYVSHVVCEENAVRHAIWDEKKHGFRKYHHQSPYYQSDTAKDIAAKIRELV